MERSGLPTSPGLDAAAGRTGWLTIGATANGAAGGNGGADGQHFSFQRYFEYQIEEARNCPSGRLL